MSQARIDQLEKQNKELREEAEKKLKEIREKYESVIRKYNDKDEECKRQGRELAQLKRKISICETEFHKLESARDQHKSQQANSLMQIADLQRRKSEVERTLTDKESYWLNMHNKLKEAEEEKEEMCRILDALKADMKVFKEKKEKEATEFNDEIVRLMQELRMKRGEELNERKKRKDSERTSESLQMEMLENVKSKKEELMAEIESQKSLIAKLEKKINQLEKDNRKWENLYSISQKENQKWQNEVEDSKKNVADLEKNLRKAENEKLELSGNLSKVRAEFDEFKIQFEKRIKEKTDENQISQRSNGDLKLKNDELEKKCEQLTQTVQELKKEEVKRSSEIELLKTESAHSLELERIKHEKTQKEVEKLQFQKSSLALQVKGLSERLAISQKKVNEVHKISVTSGPDIDGPEKQSSPIEDSVEPVKKQEFLEHNFDNVNFGQQKMQNRQSPVEVNFATNFASGIAELSDNGEIYPSKNMIASNNEYQEEIEIQSQDLRGELNSAPELSQRLNLEMCEMFRPNSSITDNRIQYESLANQKAIDQIMGHVHSRKSGNIMQSNPSVNERPDSTLMKRSGSNHEEHSERIQQTLLSDAPGNFHAFTPEGNSSSNPDPRHSLPFNQQSQNLDNFHSNPHHSGVNVDRNQNFKKGPYSKNIQQDSRDYPNTEFDARVNFEFRKQEKPVFLELKPQPYQNHPPQVSPASRSREQDRIPPANRRQVQEPESKKFLGNNDARFLQNADTMFRDVVNPASEDIPIPGNFSNPIKENRQRQKSFDEYSNISQDCDDDETSFRSSQTSLISVGSQDVYDNIQVMIQKRQEKCRNRRSQSSRWSGTQSLDEAIPGTPKKERPEVRPKNYTKRKNQVKNETPRSQKKRESEHNLSNGYCSSSSEVITKPAVYDKESKQTKIEKWRENQDLIIMVENENQELKEKLKAAHEKVAALENEKKETDDLIQRMSDSGLSESRSKRKNIRQPIDSIPGRKSSRVKLQEDLDVIEKELMIAIKHQELLESRITAQYNAPSSDRELMHSMDDIYGNTSYRNFQSPVLKKPLLDFGSQVNPRDRSLRKMKSLNGSHPFRSNVY